MQQYKNSQNTRQMAPRVDVCHDFGWLAGCGGVVSGAHNDHVMRTVLVRRGSFSAYLWELSVLFWFA